MLVLRLRAKVVVVMMIAYHSGGDSSRSHRLKWRRDSSHNWGLQERNRLSLARVHSGRLSSVIVLTFGTVQIVCGKRNEGRRRLFRIDGSDSLYRDFIIIIGIIEWFKYINAIIELPQHDLSMRLHLNGSSIDLSHKEGGEKKTIP